MKSSQTFLPPIDAEGLRRFTYHANNSRFYVSKNTSENSSRKTKGAEIPEETKFPLLKVIGNESHDIMVKSNRSFNAEIYGDAEYTRLWSTTSSSESDTRLPKLSEEPDLKKVLTKDTTVAEKEEKEGYKIVEIKSTLVDINCQRIAKVLYEGAVELDVAMLVPLFCRNLMDLPPFVFDVLRNPLLQFQTLLEDFVVKTGRSFTTIRSTNSIPSATSEAIELMIKSKLRQICRSLMTTENDEEDNEMKAVVESLQSHKPATVQNFQREFDRFREAVQIRLGLNQRQLVKQVDELHTSTKKRKQQRTEIVILEDRLSKHSVHTKEMCDVLNKKIEKVANDAVEVKKKSALQVKERNALLNAVNDECNNSKKKVARLEDQKREADKVLKTLIVGHVAEETKLREKKFKMETEKDNWIAKYDKDMGTVQEDYDVLWVDYSAQRKILDDLEARFAVLEVTYNEIIAQRAAEEEERTRARRELLSMNHSAAIIQAFWRTRAVLKRLALKSKRRGKKK